MFSNRNRFRFRHFGRMLRGRPQACPYPNGSCLSLDKLPESAVGTITCNRHLPTLERGLVNGVQITMFRNDSAQPNVIIAVGDARYVLDRRIAREVRVQVLKGE